MPSPYETCPTIGVDVFFTLSGFVITLLILKEYRATGQLRLGVFYAKRLARLWPALLAVCAVVVIGGPVFPPSAWGAPGPNAIPAPTYVRHLTNPRARASPPGADALSPSLPLSRTFKRAPPPLLESSVSSSALLASGSLEKTTSCLSLLISCRSSVSVCANCSASRIAS